MKLYLVRHGQPNPETVDAEKGLSPNGEQEIELLASILKANSISVKEIWHSDKTRARQTAAILASGISCTNGFVEIKGLNPTDRIEPIIGKILAAQADLMVVGHMPFMAHLASLLLAGDEHRLAMNFDTGAMACLDYAHGRWTLEWFAYPRLFKLGDLLDFRSYH
jgi:phosphohistidine phosphatase